MPTRASAVSALRTQRSESLASQWLRLHPTRWSAVKVKHASPTFRAVEMAKRVNAANRGTTRPTTPLEMQAVLDGNEGIAKGHPFWAQLKQYGVKPEQAHAAVYSMTELPGVTSILAMKGDDFVVAHHLAPARAMANVAAGLAAGQPLETLLTANQARLTPAEIQALRQANRQAPPAALELATQQLGNRAGLLLVDDAAEATSHATERVTIFESLLKARTAWLGASGADPVSLSTYQQSSAFGLEFAALRELAVLAPAKAATLGKAFVSALQRSAPTASPFGSR